MEGVKGSKSAFLAEPVKAQEASMLHNRLAQLREERAEGDRGFTLIELLVVVVIIGILIAIAIPLYLNYKKGANDKAAQSDLRGAISVLEQCNSDNGSYPAALPDGTGTASATVCAGKVTKTTGTTLTYATKSSTDLTAYSLVAYISSGNVDGSASGGYYCYSSAAGGSVVKKTATAPTSYQATC